MSTLAIEIPVVSVGTRVKPRRVDRAVLGMALFLMTEVMLFAGLISACMVLRAGSAVQWPPANQPRLPEWLTLGNLGILLASGAALAVARGKPRGIAVAAALGAVFFAVQGYEWSRILSFGIANGSGPFAGVFYGLVGTHAVHVLGGVITLTWLWRQVARGTASDGAKTASAMYWFFVVGVWPVLYLLVYV